MSVYIYLLFKKNAIWNLNWNLNWPLTVANIGIAVRSVINLN